MNTIAKKLVNDKQELSTCHEAISLIDIEDTVGICTTCNKLAIFSSEDNFDTESILPIDSIILAQRYDIREEDSYLQE